MAEWNPTEFQATLLEFLRRRGWSQNELHLRTGISQSVINRWLHEDPQQVVQPTDSTLQRLAPVMGISHGELMRLAGRVHADAPKSKHPPQLSRLLADIEQGWFAMEQTRRVWSEDVARAIFNPHAGRRAGRPRRERQPDEDPTSSRIALLIPA